RPIYASDPLVHLDFNPQSFVNANQWQSLEALIEHVIEVDRNDELYSEYLAQPWFHGNVVSPTADRQNLLDWLERVILDPQPTSRTIQSTARVFRIDRVPDAWDSMKRRIKRTTRKLALRWDGATDAATNV